MTLLSKETLLAQPTEMHHFAMSGMMAKVSIFGKSSGDWSLKTREQVNCERIAHYAYACDGVTKILAPKLDFSARICYEADLQKTSISVSLPRCEKTAVMRGASGDVVSLMPNSAAFLTSGDCPVLIIYDPDSSRGYSPLVCAHAGRNCLLDSHALLKGMPPREHASVVDAAMKFFPVQAERSRLKAYIMCGIAARHFQHRWNDPQYGTDNMKISVYLAREYKFPETLPSFGCIALKEIIRQQLQRQGFDNDNIGQDNVDTYADIDSETEGYRWWSNRRDHTLERNGVLITYC